MKKSLVLFAAAATLYALQFVVPQPQLAKRPSADVAASLPKVTRDARTNGSPRAKGLEIPAYLTDRPEEVVIHTAYTVSFNRKHKLPNWVAWVLTDARTRGTLPRNDQFQPDPDVKKGGTATDADYRGSGYDRGHLCPAADNKHSRQAMQECFYLSNICPQTHALNNGDWKELEEKCRRWAQRYDSLYIVSGPVVGPRERLATLPGCEVGIPKAFFKVVLRIDAAGEAHAIGFVCRQDDRGHSLGHYARSVDEVEELTGINFFSKLPKRQEQRAEAAYHLSDWAGLK